MSLYDQLADERRQRDISPADRVRQRIKEMRARQAAKAAEVAKILNKKPLKRR